MGTNLSKQKPTIKSELLNASYEFEFHQVVKLLEKMHPDRPAMGTSVFADQEIASLKSHIFLTYPPSDIYSIEPQNDNGKLPYNVTVNFLGIAGVIGPLPMGYAVTAMDRARAGDTAFRDFLDIFNHRLVSIFHRIRKKYWVGLETTEPHKTEFAKCLYSFIGVATPHLHNHLHIHDRGLLFFSGLLWQQPRSMQGLEHFISLYFGMPTKVIQFTGGWREIEEEQVTRIGINGQFNILGDTAAVGTSYWDQKADMQINFGPLDSEQFRSILPNGDLYHALCSLIRFYLGVEHTFHYNLIMKKEDVPESRLNGGMNLGWTSWLKKSPFTEDDHQVKLYPNTIVLPKNNRML